MKNEAIEIPIRLRGCLFATGEPHTPFAITLRDSGARWGRADHGLHPPENPIVRLALANIVGVEPDAIVYGILCGLWRDSCCWNVVAVELPGRGRIGAPIIEAKEGTP